jgi:hypothetical protein
MVAGFKFRKRLAATANVPNDARGAADHEMEVVNRVSDQTTHAHHGESANAQIASDDGSGADGCAGANPR